MRLSPAAKNYAFVIALGALLAGCSGGAQMAPPGAAGTSLHRAATTGTETVLYAFTGGSADGMEPYGSPVEDSSGALYGTSSASTQSGDFGAVWKLTPSGSSYTESALYEFASKGKKGAYPYAGLILDSSGALYGTTSRGGKGKCTRFYGTKGCGVVFKLKPSKSKYKETTLYDFGTSSGSDGTIPGAALLLSGGELYGTTQYGGTGSCSEGEPGCGTVFEITTKGTGYKVLYSFKGGTDGAIPEASLIAVNGTLYGTTINGGTTNSNCHQGCGIVFALTPTSSGNYTESIVYSFTGGSADGAGPGRGRGLYADSSGALYGTTQVGGSGDCYILFLSGCGVIFKLTPAGSGFTESVLYDLQGRSKDGQEATEELAADKNGNLYGTTSLAGGGSGCSKFYSVPVGCGVVFELASRTSSYTESVLHSFQGDEDGALPYGGVTIDNSGNLFGTTNAGGGSTNCTYGCGTVFEVTP
jgi:uncharacterized repeat protein (TIGR03803 family)